jgi:hypothetical protein
MFDLILDIASPIKAVTALRTKQEPNVGSNAFRKESKGY